MRIPVVDVDTLAQNWWVVLLRGVAALLFGVITLVAPGLSIAALVLVFGAYAFADGVFAIVSATRRRRTTDRWWVLLLEGIAGIVAGVLTILWPGITAIVLLYLIAARALVAGALEIVAAIRLRKVVTDEWLLALSGVAAVVFGVLLILFPGAGALALVLWIGAYALLAGGLLVALGLRVRSWDKPSARQPAPSTA